MIRDKEQMIKDLTHLALEHTYYYYDREKYDSQLDFYCAYVNEDFFIDEITTYMTREELVFYDAIKMGQDIKEYVIDVAINEF